MSLKPSDTAALYESLSADLLRFIRSRVGDDATARDLLQDVFLKIHSKADTLSDRDHLVSWVYQIARNSIIDYYRLRKPAEHLTQFHDEIPEEVEDVSSSKQLGQSVRDMIESLPEIYKEALLLTEYEGLSQKQLAGKLGISLSGAKSRVQRARQVLKDSLMKCCHFELDQFGTIIDYHPISCCCCSPETPCSPKGPC